jgi:hypothetical protein
MALIIWLLGDRKSLTRWFAKSQGSKWWIVYALSLASIPFPLLLIPNIHVMKPVGLVVPYPGDHQRFAEKQVAA